MLLYRGREEKGEREGGCVCVCVYNNYVCGRMGGGGGEGGGRLCTVYVHVCVKITTLMVVEMLSLSEVANV